MLNRLIFILITVGIISSCNRNKTIKIIHYWNHDSIKIKEQFDVFKAQQGIKNGLYESFYENGNPEFIKHFSNNLLTDTLQYFSKNKSLIEQAIYNHNMLDGCRIIYFENSKPQAIEFYKNNLLHDESKSFYENGNLLEVGKFNNNKRDGIWKFYYENGALKEMVLFKNNLEDGKYQSFYASGKKKSDGFYKQEKEDSTWHNYYETGELMEIVNFKNGKEDGITKVFSKDSILLKEITYHNGITVEYHDVISGKHKKYNFDFLDQINKDDNTGNN
jgi:antitoxin component YwqK of YwqJK toxin-antitoxin module